MGLELSMPSLGSRKLKTRKLNNVDTQMECTKQLGEVQHRKIPPNIRIGEEIHKASILEGWYIHSTYDLA